MAKIVECIPNISEGRDEKNLRELAACAAGVPGAALLNHSADADHNRSVYTLAGSPKAVAEAAFRLCRLATQRIDLRRHSGQHPRLGATDVIPFVPLQQVELAECAALARQLGQRIWQQLGVPVYLYEAAAASPARQNLADVRRGEFEGLAHKMAQDGWAPDYGANAPHPTAGAVAVGARMPLVAFNVYLATGNVQVAKDIAKVIRGSSGGFGCCKAIGLFMKERGLAQVSMNLVDTGITPIYEVFDAIRAEAQRRGTTVVGSELIGLAPARALVDCAAHYLQLENYHYESQVLEHRLNALVSSSEEDTFE